MPDPFYFDSSALLKRYLNEPGTPRVFELTRTTSGNLIFISSLTNVEIVAALKRNGKQGGTLTDSAAQQAIDEFRQDVALQYSLIELTPAMMVHATDLAETHALRGADAVQLAAALEADRYARESGLALTFVSSDIELLKAARKEGLSVEDPTLTL